MHSSTRAMLVATGALLLAALTACSSGSEAQPENRPTTAGPTPQAPSGVSITNPKNAAAVPLCDLLPSEAATSLGYKTQGEKRENMLNSDAPPACQWESPQDNGLVGSLTVLERRIGDYYANPSTWSDFKKLTIAGHPAARANISDPMKTGQCSIYLGTQENQMISSQVTLPAPDTGKKDPCIKARKMLEAVVPTLPPAQ